MTQSGESLNAAQGMFLAKALFDNIAETPDELAFRRGDVLTVVEQDASGLEGWWLCSLRGKHGIAPGNRLKILSGMGDNAKSGMDVYDQPNAGPQQDYDVPPANRGTLEIPGASALAGRRTSHDSQRGSGGPGSRPGSRKASLANDLYDTPPTSKWTSVDSGSSGIYDTPPSSKRASSERTPPNSNRSSATSRDSGPGLAPSPSPLHLLNLPPALQNRRRSGGSAHSSDNCYDTPPGSNRSSLERILTEEGPPIYESLSPAGSSGRLAPGGGDNGDEPTYDTPPNRGHSQLPPRKRGLSHASAVSQSSLHSAPSVESLLSNTSGVSSAQLSHNTSLPDSARSSMDLPADTYDVPPSAHHDGDASRKQLSTDSGLGFYDSPVKSRPSSSTSGNSLCPPSQNGTLKSSQSSFNCKPSSSSSTNDIKRSRSLEHALDDFYDTPKNNAPKIGLKKHSSGGSSSFGSATALNAPMGVYDIPPQVTRDSVISARSDSSNEENQRLSSSSLECDRSLDSSMWDALPLDLDSALEVLTKRQQDVSKATSRLSAFVTEDWRTRASLEKTLYDIKVACSVVKSSLQEFVEFSLRAVSSASRLPDRHLAARLQKQVSPLQSTLDFVSKSFFNLEEAKWQVTLLSEPLPKNKPDDLGQIALVAKDLLPEVKKVASFIQANGTTLFKKSSDYKVMSSKPPIGPGFGNSLNKQKVIQQRPLPAVPGESSNKPVPTKVSTSDLSSATSKLSLYDIKAALHQDDYEECDDLLPSPPTSQTQKHDVIQQQQNIKQQQQQQQEIMDQLSQEYDYVELDPRDAMDIKTNEGSADSGIASLGEDYVDSGTLKAQNKPKASLEDKEASPSAPKALTDAEAATTRLDESDIDTIPVRESSSGEDKTPTNKTGPCSVALAEAESNTSQAGEEESSSMEQDLKTPVNVSTDSSGSDQGQTFVLPSPENPVSTAEADEADDEVLDPNDRQVLVYYADQMSSHATLLANSTDAFLGVVASGQPPNVFISHSKFLIVSAHKLVHIGDSIHRSLASNSISSSIMRCANNLCDCLKASVTATKSAALQYPSAPALQEMVDRVMAVSHAAHELRLVITQAIK